MVGRPAACWSSCSRSSVRSSSPTTCAGPTRSSAWRDAVRRLGEVGSPQGILDRAAEELGTSSEFDRVLISEVGRAACSCERSGARPDPRRRGGALEELRARRSASSTRWSRTRWPAASGPRSSRCGPRARAPARRLSDVLGWESYVVAALVVQGRPSGCVHADASTAVAARCARRRGRVAVRRRPRGRVRARRPARDAAAAPPRAAIGGPLDEHAPRAARLRRRLC